MMSNFKTTEAVSALALTAVLMLAGCVQPATPSKQPTQITGRVDMNSATDLIRSHMSQQGTTSAQSPSLIELTNDDVFQRMGVQVFLCTEECTSYIIKQGSVSELCEGFGGNGLQSMCVADLDNDQSPELVFTYSWGSGVHRSHVGICYEDRSTVQTAIAPFWYYGDLFVKKEDDQNVTVVVGDYQSQLGDYKARFSNYAHIADFGEVRIDGEDKDGTLSCRVEVSETLPDELREEIDRQEQ